MRSISRVVGVSINTVTKLLVDAGRACAEYHDQMVRGVRARRVQVDEIWAFTYAKQRRVDEMEKAPVGAGDAWTWTALDADSKLIVSWRVGPRGADTAFEFMCDLADRFAQRIQLTTDGLKSYVDAVDGVFGLDIDYAQLIKPYGSPPDSDRRYSPPTCNGTVVQRISGQPDPRFISTSYVERRNLTMRMSIRRFTRLTNAFSRKLENHAHALALYFVWYTFVRIHKTLRMTPAMAAGLGDTLRDEAWIVSLIDDRALPPRTRWTFEEIPIPWIQNEALPDGARA